MRPDGSIEPQEELNDAIASFQILEDAPASDKAKAIRRVLRAAKTAAEILEAGGASTPSPQTPSGEGAHTIAPALSKLEFISVTDFLALDIPPVEWLLDGVIPKGALGCCSGYAKVGKTTFLFHYLRVGTRLDLRAPPSVGGSGGKGCEQSPPVEAGDSTFLGRTVTPVRAAWIRLEEPLPLFRARIASLHLGGRDLFVLKPSEGPTCPVPRPSRHFAVY